LSQLKPNEYFSANPLELREQVRVESDYEWLAQCRQCIANHLPLTSISTVNTLPVINLLGHIVSGCASSVSVPMRIRFFARKADTKGLPTRLTPDRFRCWCTSGRGAERPHQVESKGGQKDEAEAVSRRAVMYPAGGLQTREN